MGALAKFQTGGGVYDDPENDADYDDTGYGEGDDGDYSGSPAPAGALSQGQGAPSDDEIERYQQLGGALSGSPQDIAGALSRQNQSVDDAYAAKKSRLEHAMSILKASGQGQANLPLMAASAAMMGPSWSFGQSVSNAANAAIPQIEKQRQDQYQRALDEGKLDVSGADIDIQRAKEHQANWLKQQGLGEKYLRYSAALRQRQQAEALRQQQQADRQAYLDRMAQAREDAVQQAAERQRAAEEKSKSFNKWIGTDPESGHPVFQNDLGQTKIGDAPINAKPGVRGGAGGSTALQENIKALVKFGIAKDEKDAFAKLKTSASNPQEHNRMVLRMIDTINKGSLVARPLTEVTQEAESAIRQMEAQAAEKPAAQPLPNSPIARTPGAWGDKAQAPLPPAAVQSLREGVKTKFANGQEWSLQGGKPVRLK